MILVLVCFLGNLRTAFIVALALPLCALVSVICMKLYGISANLMSLGGIAIGIGMLGDGAIVMVENIYRHLNSAPGEQPDKTAVIRAAAHEVARPIAFSIAIIILVFLPIFTLQGVEGKMFSPMAFTISFALLGSILMALIVAPVLSRFLLGNGKRAKDNIFIRTLKNAYHPMVTWAVKKKYLVMAAAVVAFAGSLLLVPFIGTEFIPTLEEGSILIGVTMSPSISLEKGTETILRMERRIVKYDEIEETISRVGRPEAGSHPHPVNYAEVHIELKDQSQWTRFHSKQELVEALSNDLSRIPGVQLNFTQPIQNAFDELLSGIKAQLAIKVFGDDLTVLRQKATEIGSAINDVPGLGDLSTEQSFGQPQVQIIADRQACSRFGVTVGQILEMIELAVGGEVIDSLYLNTRRFGIHLRLQERFRVDPEAIENLLVHTLDGSIIPISQVARVEQVIGPIQINRENNQRRWIVQGNIRGRDLGSVIADIQRIIKEKIELPPGYFVEYGGQFENQQRAMARLAVIVPCVIAAVFLMLWMSFGVARYVFIIILNVPLALIGGILGLFLAGEYLSVPASVGFIALFGIAVQNGVVLISYINVLRRRGVSLDRAIIMGSLLRLRPVLMTAITTVLGLLPLLLATGLGSEVQRPLAIVVVFGLTSSTLLTLFVIPAVYRWLERDQAPARPQVSID